MRQYKKDRIQDLLGEENTRLQEANESDDSDSESSDDEKDMDQEANMEEQENEDDEADSDEEDFKNTAFDNLHADAMDIPRVSNLKVISRHKPEEKKVDKKT